MKFIVDIEAKETWWFDGMLMGYHWDIMGICDTDFSYDKKWDFNGRYAVVHGQLYLTSSNLIPRILIHPRSGLLKRTDPKLKQDF